MSTIRTTDADGIWMDCACSRYGLCGYHGSTLKHYQDTYNGWWARWCAMWACIALANKVKS